MKPAEFRPAEKYDTNPYYDTTEWPGYIEPTGTIEITENGEVDVTQYAKADVSVEGGGGGGSSFGSLQYVAVEYDLPTVDGKPYGAADMYSISSGDTMLAQGMAGILNPVAAGLTAVSYAEAEYTKCDAYVCSVTRDEQELYAYTSVTPWNGTVTVGSMEQSGNQYVTYTFTVPELDFDPETFTGERLVLYVHS